MLDEQENAFSLSPFMSNSTETGNPLFPDKQSKNISIFQIDNEGAEFEDRQMIFGVLSKTGAISSELLANTNTPSLTQISKTGGNLQLPFHSASSKHLNYAEYGQVNLVAI